MKVLHFSTNGRRGGAGEAAWRLHGELRAAGVQSQMLTLDNTDTAPDLVHLGPPAEGGDNRARSFRELFIDSNRTAVSNTWFSAEIEGFDLTGHAAVREADILHLHWVSGLLSAPHVAQLLATGKPVVWTLHDMAPFTGGCHYSAGCTGFLSGCHACPQLKALSDVLPAAQLADKCSLWHDGRLGVIALNSWMATLAGKAPAFSRRKIAVIPNGIDLARFHPQQRKVHRRRLGIPTDTVVFLFVADSFAERRKGPAVLAAALEIMGESQKIRKAAAEGRLVFITAGKGELPKTRLPIKSLGWCEEEQLAGHYAAADAFVLPSLEDNLPNTVIESLSAGTPVIGFNVGGVPEMILDGQTGHLVSAGDAVALSKALIEAFDDPTILAAMRPQCRVFAETHFDGQKNARLVAKFYEHLLATRRSTASKHISLSPGPALATFLREPLVETLGRPPSQLLTSIISASAEVLKHERNLLQAQLADLQKNFDAVEKDRLERGKLIEIQGQKLTKLEADFDTRIKELQALYISTEVLKNERNLIQAQFADLLANFNATEKDRNDRGKLIETQGEKLTKVEGEFDIRLKELKALYTSSEALKNERNLLKAQLADLQKNFTAVERDRNERGSLIEIQGEKLTKLEAEFDARLKELKQLYTSAEALKNERNLLRAQLADLHANFAAVENDRAERGKVIETHGRRIVELEKMVWLTEQNRDYWKNANSPK